MHILKGHDFRGLFSRNPVHLGRDVEILKQQQTELGDDEGDRGFGSILCGFVL
jgi:hypothetical protein